VLTSFLIFCPFFFAFSPLFVKSVFHLRLCAPRATIRAEIALPFSRARSCRNSQILMFILHKNQLFSGDLKFFFSAKKFLHPPRRFRQTIPVFAYFYVFFLFLPIPLVFATFKRAAQK
jgi:hypothetical protein